MAVISSTRTHTRWRGALSIAAFAGVMLTWSAGPVAATGSQAPPPVDAGDVAVVNPNKQSEQIDHGDADTQFSVRPPDGATCPGDSLHDQWRVQTFIIPVNDDPTAIRYGAIGPEPTGNGRYALFEVDTTPFVHGLTSPNPGAGQPGAIPALPAFDFSVSAGDHIPSGDYRIGIACTYFGDTAEFWDTEIVITNPADGQPGKFLWHLASVPAPAVEADDSSALPTIPVFSILGVALLGLIVWRLRTSRAKPALAKEPR